MMITLLWMILRRILGHGRQPMSEAEIDRKPVAPEADADAGLWRRPAWVTLSRAPAPRRLSIGNTRVRSVFSQLGV